LYRFYKGSTISDERKKEGKFLVEVQFWNDIENHISTSSLLSKRYYSNHNYSGQLKIAKEFFNKEKYLDAINSFTDEDIKSMNHLEKYAAYYLLANCYYLVEDYDNFLYNFEKVKCFEWNDERCKTLIIIKSVVANDIDKALETTELYLDTEPNNTQYIVLKNLIKINQNDVTDFENLPKNVQSSYSIKLAYMKYYFSTYKFDKCDEMKILFDKDECMTPSYISQSLEECLFRYVANSNQHHIIEAELKLLERNLNINQIDVPSLRTFTLNCIITANCVLNDESSIRYYYKYIKNNNYELMEGTIVNLLSLIKRTSDKDFFNTIYQDYYSDNLIKYFIDGLYHFGDTDELDRLINSDNTIDISMINEIKSLISVNKLNDNDFLDFIKDIDIINNNSVRGLALLGLKLYKIESSDFERLNHKISLVNINNSDVKTILADYYFKTKQYKISSKILDTLINDSSEEYLLIIQIHSLIESFQYQKAKDFVDQNIHKFDKHLDEFAGLVSRLDNKTQDFSSTETLLPKLDKYSNSSWYWRLKLFLSLYNDNIGQLKKDTKLIPLELDNNPVNVCWLVSYELLYSKQEKAVERVINLWRSNPADLEILSAIQELFFSTMLSSRFSKKFANNSNPLFDLMFLKVIDGCFVSYFEESESKGKYIDFKSSGKNLDNVISPNSALGQQFLGRSTGEEFEILGNFGIKRNIKIEEILSIPLAIFRNNIEMASDINNPFNMISFTMDLDTEEGRARFIKDINQTSRSNEQLERQLKIYQENPLTITCLADFIGKDISELTYNWISDSRFPLRTIDDHYTNDLGIETLKVLLDKEPAVVIDLFTLLELQRLDSLDFITSNISIYIPKVLLNSLQALSDKHLYEYKAGDRPISIHSSDNDFTVTEMDIELLEKRSNDLKSIIEYIESNMNVTSAYGNNSNSEIIEALNKFLPETDKAIIRLCQEKSLPLLSLDARLRALAHQAGVNTINFHDYLSLSISIDDSRHADFQTKQFIDNRNAADFKIHNLLDFALKSSKSLNVVFNKFINHMSVHYDFELILKQLNTIIKLLTSRDFLPTNGFIERICEILFCNLANYNKLDFDNHKTTLNSYFERYFFLNPVKVDSFESMKTVKDNTLYIVYGTSKPSLCARTIN